MAALLRQGARRIGGSVLQRAFAEERCRLEPRCMLTTGQPAPEEITRDIQRKRQELADAIAEGRRSLTASNNWRDIQHNPCGANPSAQEVQQKTEELYEALSKVEGWGNRRLLQHLAVRVNPRPHDTQWSRLRASKWAFNVFRVVAHVSFASAVAIILHALRNDKIYFVEKRETAAK